MDWETGRLLVGAVGSTLTPGLRELGTDGAWVGALAVLACPSLWLLLWVGPEPVRSVGEGSPEPWEAALDLSRARGGPETFGVGTCFSGLHLFTSHHALSVFTRPASSHVIPKHPKRHSGSPDGANPES